jgi:BMFP domain-containing protein YqiC
MTKESEKSNRREEFEDMMERGGTETQDELEQLAELLDELEDRDQPKTKTTIYNSYSG